MFVTYYWGLLFISDMDDFIIYVVDKGFESIVVGYFRSYLGLA